MARPKGAKHGSNPPRTFICVGCGKPFNRTKYPSRKLPQYCESACRKSHRITKRCEICNKEIAIPPSRNGIRKYCSVECRIEGTKRKRKICKKCKVEYRPSSSANAGYCSHRCAIDARKDTRLHKVCETCNKAFYVRKGYTHAQFCSQQCSAIAIGKKQRGPNNYNWRGGHISHRGPNWNKQADRARKRDNHTCQSCSIQRKKPKLPVHHIVAYREFNNDYLSANILSNLITLCEQCHAIAENPKRSRDSKGIFRRKRSCQ